VTYLIVEASTASALEERVQRKQQEGWEPLGGVSVTAASWRDDGAGTVNVIRRLYTQAMVRYWEGQDFTMDPDEMTALLRESTVTGVLV
jgi:hypothetical protein